MFKQNTSAPACCAAAASISTTQLPAVAVRVRFELLNKCGMKMCIRKETLRDANERGVVRWRDIRERQIEARREI
jgi:hypothetical protein